MEKPELILLTEGTDQHKVLLLINGYTSDKYSHPTAFVPEVKALQSIGWQGAIYLLWWNASRSSAPLYRTITPAHWQIVKQRAERTGIDYFAEIINQVKDKEISIIAHSLGVRLVYYGLLNITPSDFSIRDVILFGGAIRRNKREWPVVAQNIQGRLYNFYNRDDSVLNFIYKVAEFRTHSPCGQKPIEVDNPNIYNINLTGVFKKRKIDNHTGYWTILTDILQSEKWPNIE